MGTLISKYFTLEEITASNTATAKGISANFNPPASVIANGTALANNVLDKVRELLGVPTMASSWYRCPELNTMEGGMPNSQHLFGEAADIYTAQFTPDEIYAKIKASNIAFDELIIEHDSHGNRWVHISWAANGNQRGVCYKGVLQPEGGTLCVADGYGAFKSMA